MATLGKLIEFKLQYCSQETKTKVKLTKIVAHTAMEGDSEEEIVQTLQGVMEDMTGKSTGQWRDQSHLLPVLGKPAQRLFDPTAAGVSAFSINAFVKVATKWVKDGVRCSTSLLRCCLSLNEV